VNDVDALTRFRMARYGVVNNSDALQIYDLANAALAEQAAEIYRLKDALAGLANHAVLHATGAQCEVIIASGVVDSEILGTVLRSTDDTRSWELTGAGWQLR
jgi:hypothetical protein